MKEEEEETPEAERTEAWKPPPSTLESLNKTMKEVYALMQHSSAKGKLLAEQVSMANVCPTEPFVLTALYCGAVPFDRWQL